MRRGADARRTTPHPPMMSDWPVVFRTYSDIEATVVSGLLEAHGIPVVRSSDAPHSVFPFRVEAHGEMRIAVPPHSADDAARLIESHRSTGPNGVVVPIRREFEAVERRLGYRFGDRGLLEHALTHKSRAHEDASGGVARNKAPAFLGHPAA